MPSLFSLAPVVVTMAVRGIAFCPKTRAMTSRRFAVVEVEHSTEPPAPVYWSIMRSNSRVPVDQFVAEPLMISFPV